MKEYIVIVAFSISRNNLKRLSIKSDTDVVLDNIQELDVNNLFLEILVM